jgi:8-oxo-dGTP pyrophosphatase MutT (NUDIX family)
VSGPREPGDDTELPVSVKGVLLTDGGVVLLQNERHEWELPGGRVDPGDRSAEATLRRECAEELGIEVSVGELIDTWVYEPVPGRRVSIVTYTCTTTDPPADFRVSDEHSALMVAPLPLDTGLELPNGYRRSIRRATE